MGKGAEVGATRLGSESPEVCASTVDLGRRDVARGYGIHGRATWGGSCLPLPLYPVL